MIIAKATGGLGNQLFQYALGRHLALLNNDTLKMEANYYINSSFVYTLGRFNTHQEITKEEDYLRAGLPNIGDASFYGRIKRKIFRISEGLKPIHKKKFITEPDFTFCPEILNVRSSCYLSGVWQSEKYFKNIEDTIRKEITLRNEPSSEVKNWIAKTSESNSVSIHIRRGDYVDNPRINKFHGVCPIEYYTNAIDCISQSIHNPTFYVFSNDIEWAKNNLRVSYPIFFVSDKIIPDHEELIIMSNCKHNIIANSTFSWWGAWLNVNQDKIVIAPQKWFTGSDTNTKDLIPEAWVRI
ncbi:MAG: Glycosyl transferase family 11 [Parcubacteria group bacterium GW2011_GWC1_42_11]|uniref:Glycosyl transferase family 11 n=1 Tax=Candidatus Nomurabacteria bacterium GW2011_GWC2_42_20 TaxID=1618756 RepID=A0A0G0ZGW1_9BACT|nr:MAG: Glycosyl transferase family 11 [Parcubacteria group bacterium GW2011_GWC1_42_11]KKS47924.1 MAG: Glycosyl transferase family 11 [Candidatus Nomurabacteria bacterium GW2011_GWC2_42_20]KKT09691.1 MAG: Glycosyl transferase family 11 [Candidatus Nomurabacteria bacterium GW2011_GWB1_43_20]TAN36629.1 MAG: alpha-1,2-fucosyltransferase [Patescibacteria group bacterium]HBH71687.1 alpha-1,2-fucosyltransferase [Candidatus Yonathbacteria bacterium]